MNSFFNFMQSYTMFTIYRIYIIYIIYNNIDMGYSFCLFLSPEFPAFIASSVSVAVFYPC